MNHKEPTLNPRQSRREFLSRAATGIAISALPGFLSNCREVKKDPTMPTADIALQLYTLRDAIEKDVAGTLERIAAIGYRSVETAFFPDGVTIEQAGRLLERAGLSVCSVHCEIPVPSEQSRILEMTEAYRCKKIVWHGWPEDERYKTVAGTKELASIYNEANGFAKANGLQFGLHNHWWEFERQPDGRLAYLDLLKDLEEDIFFEIDTYWVKVAGLDPAGIVADFGTRAPLLHIKDGPGTFTKALDEDKPDPMVAAGQGVQDFPAIVAAAAGRTEWMIVELDQCATDMFTAVEESFRYLTTENLATAGG